MDADLPIALRRTRRSTSSLSAAYTGQAAAKGCAIPGGIAAVPSPPATPVSRRTNKISNKISNTTPTKTPARRGPLSRKHVRFSDPGVLASLARDERRSASTGLTPLVRRTSLVPSRSPRRRVSSPAAWPASLDSPAEPFSGDVALLPLRQVLDGRVKRRLRRNGLSEEMNTIYAAKRARAAAAAAELEQLRAAVTAKDAEIARLQGTSGGGHDRHDVVDHVDDPGDDTIFQDNERILGLQREVRMLRRQLAQPRDGDGIGATHNWTVAARDPFGLVDDDYDDYGVHDDDRTEVLTDVMDDNDAAFGDRTMAELQCSTPIRVDAKRGPASASMAGPGDSQLTISMHSAAAADVMLTPPATSPTAWEEREAAALSPLSTLPVTPTTPRLHLFCTVMSATARVETADVAVQADTDPQADTAALAAALEAHQSLVKRLEATLCAFAADDDDGAVARVEARVALVLRALSDKAAALAAVGEALAGLGFDGTDSQDAAGPLDALDMVARVAAAFRTARLELEYATPGEVTLPLTAPGARVLDVLLVRLRALGQQVRAADTQIDEYHALEQGLRQQLGARAAAMDDMAREIAVLEEKARANAEPADMMDEGHADTASSARVAELEVGLDRLKGAVASYARDVAELEALVQRLEAQLRDKTAEADAAHAVARQLRADHAGLADALAAERRRAQQAAARLQTELARVGALGHALLVGGDGGDGGCEDGEDGAADKAVAVGARRWPTGRQLFSLRRGRRAMSEGEREGEDGNTNSTADAGHPSASPIRARKRRRYDSQLGFLDEEDGVEV